MLCYIFVIGLVLPHFTLAKGITKENKTEIDCDKPEVKEAGDKFFDCFSKNVTYSITKNNLACDIRGPPIFEYIQVANQSCYNDTIDGPGGNRSAEEFIKLVEFSIRNDAFQDFVKNSGVECIAAVRDKISECAKKEVGSVEEDKPNKHRKYDNLWEMTRLTIDSRSCKATERIKHCTQKAMRHERHCKHHMNNVLYVGSLFEYMLEICSRMVPTWRKSNLPNTMDPFRNKMAKGTRTTHALLGVLLVMAILAIFYVCVRDCRAPRGQWKAINDRISMSMMNRRRSLVNNEACQAN